MPEESASADTARTRGLLMPKAVQETKIHVALEGPEGLRDLGSDSVDGRRSRQPGAAIEKCAKELRCQKYLQESRFIICPHGA